MSLKRFYILLFLCWPVVFAAAGDSINRAGRPRVGLVLSGGGAKGMAHVGALKVIEELGIPVDYIGGTSMGSIVGGLYALGYTSVQLENYMKEADWENLLTDRVLRRHVSIYEKGERKRYWLQFPIKGGKINLPLGIFTGQNVSNLFAELASPAYAEDDFSKLAIPFLCVATDIETGTEVILEHGNLAKAMRASMAIPSVFTPEVIDGKRLYDGGLTNNFPANLVRDKGIDILIGVDVTSQTKRTELNNIYQVMEQVVFMASLPLKEDNKKLCKVLITPNISEYTASSFNAVDSLIARGECAARLHYDDLNALADSLRSFGPDRPKEQAICPQPLYSFYVSEVKVNGLKYISKDFILQKLELDFPCELTFAQLDDALNKVKGSQVFHSIVYQLNPLPDGMVELQFDCEEQSVNIFRVGLHYDAEYEAALLLNLSLGNALLNNSKAGAELSIGEHPAFSLTYLHSPDLKPVGKTLFKSKLTPDWLFHIDGYRFDAYNYSGNQRTTAYTFSSLSTGIHLLISPSINSLIGGGLIGDYSVINTKIGSGIEDVKSNYMYLNYLFFYERDTYNEDYFPTKGSKFRLEGAYSKGLSKNVRYSDVLIKVIFRSNFACSPIRRWTVHWGIDAGSIFGPDVPPQYMMYLGGAPDKHLRNDMTFVGMHFMQEYDKNAWVAHLNNQVRLWNNVYVTFRANLGKIDNEPVDLFSFRNIRAGYGVSIQFNSVVGPIGFTLSSSNLTQSLLGAFNLGFWF
ncbi:MAG: patatin-like phospholipase family protein [Bacteroidales bacterium]|jgi:NTE family protein|nr:patatin-like phospholipase family protein [Bacteroidales bacterium]